jgi:hypothetical protein
MVPGCRVTFGRFDVRETLTVKVAELCPVIVDIRNDLSRGSRAWLCSTTAPPTWDRASASRPSHAPQ